MPEFSTLRITPDPQQPRIARLLPFLSGVAPSARSSDLHCRPCMMARRGSGELLPCARLLQAPLTGAKLVARFGGKDRTTVMREDR